MPRVRMGIIGGLVLAIGLFGFFPRAVYAEALCSVSASGSLTQNSSGSVSIRVANAGDTPLQWVYIYKSDSASPFTGGSADGWSVASSDESRMEFTGGTIEPSAATSYSLGIIAGAESGSLGFDVQASESSDGSNRVECGSTSVDIVEAPSSTPTPTSSSTTTTVTTVITATPLPTVQPTPTPVPDKSGPIIRVTTDISKPFKAPPLIEGKISDGSGVSSASYSIDAGKNYIPVDALTGATIKTFSFTPQATLDDNYAIVVRAVDGAGNVAIMSAGTLIIDRMPPRIGASYIALGSISIDEAHGVISLIANVPYRITISAVGGPIEMKVQPHGVLGGSQLSKNHDTGLWEGTLSLSAPGDATLSVLARDGAGNVVTSDLVTLRGVVGGVISDGRMPLAEVRVRVFVKNTKGKFVEWNGVEYGQVSLGRTDKEGKYASMLPPGTYYVQYEKDGYTTVRTRIFMFEKASVVSADVLMRPRRGFWIVGKWFIPLFDTEMQTIEITPVSQRSEFDAATHIRVGEVLPYVPFNYSGNPMSYLTLRGKQTLITFLTLWSPSAIRQLRVINQLAANANINVLGVLSQHTDSSVSVFAKRGAYRVALVADPDGIASDAVSLHTVPMHIILDRTGVVRKAYTGFMDEEALKTALVGNE